MGRRILIGADGQCRGLAMISDREVEHRLSDEARAEGISGGHALTEKDHRADHAEHRDEVEHHGCPRGQADGVGTVVFNRPDRRNALSREVFGALGDYLDQWRQDDSVAAVVITGGEEMFCAGLDLDFQSGFTPESRATYAEACLRVYGALLDYPKPTIAACAGPTLGGGCDIAGTTASASCSSTIRKAQRSRLGTARTAHRRPAGLGL